MARPLRIEYDGAWYHYDSCAINWTVVSLNAS